MIVMIDSVECQPADRCYYTAWAQPAVQDTGLCVTAQPIWLLGLCRFFQVTRLQQFGNCTEHNAQLSVFTQIEYRLRDITSLLVVCAIL